MVISIALFGFGASGTYLALTSIRNKHWIQRFSANSGPAVLLPLFAISAIASFLVVNHLPLDYFRLPVEPLQLVYLIVAYLLLALPFFFSGMMVSFAYMAKPEKTGLVYFAGMCGSALGAALPIPLLQLLDEGRLVIIFALIALFPVLLPIPDRISSNTDGPAQKRIIIGLGWACGLVCAAFAVYLLAPSSSAWIRVAPSPYKALSQVLKFPNTQISARHNSIRGRIDRITTPFVRFAPGLSLQYNGPLPDQDAVYKDGDNQLVLYNLAENSRDSRFAENLLSYAGYHLHGQPSSVLLVLSGGGVSIACAAASGAKEITILEESAEIAAMLRQQYPYKILNLNQRSYLARNESVYDIIHIENWGASIPGAAVLNQQHMFTIEALIDFWNHLNPTGVAIISRKLLLPPSDSIRLWSAAYEALMSAGIERPDKHLVMLRNFDTFTLILSKARIHRQRIVDFAETLNFDLVYLPNMDPQQANRFNVFDKPYHYDEISRLAALYQSGRQQLFFRKYKLDVAPQSDMRPFPARFLKWTQVIDLYHSMGSRFYSLFMSGEIVVAIVFIEALIVALLLLLIPIIAGTRGTPKPRMSRAIYFFCVGAGFMFVEIYFIKRSIVLVGDPVISFMLVLAGLLFFSGLGGRWIHRKPQLNLQPALTVLIVVLVLEAAIFEVILPDLLKKSDAVRTSMIILLLLPAGFLMGLPFPLAMRDLLDEPVQRAYAWSINGCASVLSAIAAAQVAISWGIVHVAATGILAYVVAVAAIRNGSKA